MSAEVQAAIGRSQERSYNHRTIHLLLDLDDYNRFRSFAFDHGLGDSAITFRVLLELAHVGSD